MEIRFRLPDDNKRARELIALITASLSPAIFVHAWRIAAGEHPSPDDFAEARRLAIEQWGLTLKTFHEQVPMTVIPDPDPSAPSSAQGTGA